MTSALLHRAPHAAVVSGSRRGRRVIARAADQQPLPFDPSAIVGDKLGKWMKTPFDLLAFGSRASAGALVSAPERLPRLQSDIERVIELVQSPRPLEEKQEVLFKEIEDTMVEFLERGADVETDVLSNIKTVLPQEVANLISEIIPEPPSKHQEAEVTTDASNVAVTTYYKEDVVASQIASEVTEIKRAVEGLQAALEDIRSNSDPARISIIKLNLKESRDLLARRLNEVAVDDTTDSGIVAATREARILLDEVNTQFSF